MEGVKMAFMASHVPTFPLNRSTYWHTYWHYNCKQVCTSSGSEVRSNKAEVLIRLFHPQPSRHLTIKQWRGARSSKEQHHIIIRLCISRKSNNSHMYLFCRLLESGFKLPGSGGWLALYRANLFMAPLLFAARNSSECFLLTGSVKRMITIVREHSLLCHLPPQRNRQLWTKRDTHTHIDRGKMLRGHFKSICHKPRTHQGYFSR